MSASCERLSSHHAAMRSAACPILASISGLKCLIKPCRAGMFEHTCILKATVICSEDAPLVQAGHTRVQLCTLKHLPYLQQYLGQQAAAGSPHGCPVQGWWQWLGSNLNTMQGGRCAAQPHLHGPGSSISQGADGVPLDLLGDLPQHVDLLDAGIPLLHAGHQIVQPPCALAAGGALPAGLVLVEVGQPAGAGLGQSQGCRRIWAAWAGHDCQALQDLCLHQALQHGSSLLQSWLEQSTQQGCTAAFSGMKEAEQNAETDCIAAK